MDSQQHQWGDTEVDVLVVEDDTALRDLIIAVLQDEHIRVEGGALGWEAHRWIRERCPKVVILDIAMPDVDGIQLFYLLRADPQTRELPVIFLTAYPQKVHDELPNYEEMRAVLVAKPFDVESLLAVVRAALEL
jgi:DNA-binding response OmpR family regulator